jgi:transposase
MLQRGEDNHYLRRIEFNKNLCQGETIPESVGREGRSAAGTRWAEEWSEGEFDQLMPSFGGGRPPKLDDD